MRASMASSLRRLLGPLSCVKKTRYLVIHNPLSFSVFSLSTIEVQSVHDKSTTDLNESYVLDELSSLLPISRCKSYSITNTFPAKPLENHEPFDCFLLPEEKLRGVFLQKLSGNFAIERALSSVDVELSLDLVTIVVGRGNLSGESMVTFFNWAIKQPTMSKDVTTYNVIIKALGRRKFFDYMEGILHDMKEEEVTPNSETLSFVFDSFIRARRVYKAVDMFELSDRFGFKRDTDSLNVLLQCICRRSHVGAATWFMNKMKGKVEFSNTTYNIIIGGWARFGRVSETERNLKVMLDDGFSPDCSTFRCLIEVLGRSRRMDDAIEVYDHMREKGCEADTSIYNAMISNFISVRNFDECMKYYKALLSSNCNPDLDTYTKLITALLAWRKVADALEIFDEMLSRDIVPTTGLITCFIRILCSYGPPHAAMIFHKKARKVGCKISLSAYKLLLMRLSRFGKCGMLLRIWEEMQETGYASDIEVYEHVINGLCNNGQLENAILVMEEALRGDLCPSKLICSKLNNKLMSSNKVERAYELLLKIKKARRGDNARKFWRRNGWHF